MIAAAALGLENVGKGIECCTRIGVRVEPAMSFGADPAPLADHQRAPNRSGQTSIPRNGGGIGVNVTQYYL